MRRKLYSCDGQATVEFVALLPIILLLLAMVWQGVLVGQAYVAAGSAARDAARAEAIGRDSCAAARRAVPARWQARLSVVQKGHGTVLVKLAVPTVVGNKYFFTVQSSTHFEPQASSGTVP